MHPTIQCVWDHFHGHLSLVPETGSIDSLAKRNPHYLDEHIVFEERRHLYAISNQRGTWLSAWLTSVTKLIDLCKDPFPAKMIANNIAKKQKRLEEELFANEMQVAMLRALPLEERRAWLQNYYGEYMNLTTGDAVQEHWRKGAAHGTALHLDIERHFNGLEPILPPSKEWAQFLSFLSHHPNVEWFRTEWRIFDPSILVTGTLRSPRTDVAGTIDGVAAVERDDEGRVTVVDLYDWKRAKDIHKKETKKYKPPLNHIISSDINKYSIQLNLYKYILEKNYNIRIRDMYIVVMHPNYDSYQKIQAPPMVEDIQKLIDHHLTLLTRDIEKCLVN